MESSHEVALPPEPAPTALQLVPEAIPVIRGLDRPAHLHETLIRAHSALGDGVVVLRGERFVYVNDAFCRLTGYTRQELCDEGFRVDHLWAPHERERMRDLMRRRLAGEIPEDHYEVSLAPIWGPLVHVEVSVRSLPTPQGGLRLAIVRDVTERKRAQEALEAARREVAQNEKLATLGSLVSGVAHEVRTPLAYIQNSLFLLRRHLEDLDKGKVSVQEALAGLSADIGMAEEGVDRVNRLVKDLGRFTRLPTEPTRCRLDEVVGEALKLYRVTHPGEGVTVLEDLDPTPPMMLDRGKIQQVVLNLVENATEALRYGGTVRVSTRAQPQSGLLVVQDDGPGIPPEKVGRIFEPFYTTKVEGMGLGLSIVRRIVHLHRGTIQCHSSPGNGTTFTVHLPA